MGRSTLTSELMLMLTSWSELIISRPIAFSNMKPTAHGATDVDGRQRQASNVNKLDSAVDHVQCQQNLPVALPPYLMK